LNSSDFRSFFQAVVGIRVFHVTGVQTCALPIYQGDVAARAGFVAGLERLFERVPGLDVAAPAQQARDRAGEQALERASPRHRVQIGRASWRERTEIAEPAVCLEKRQALYKTYH